MNIELTEEEKRFVEDLNKVPTDEEIEEAWNKYGDNFKIFGFDKEKYFKGVKEGRKEERCENCVKYGVTCDVLIKMFNERNDYRKIILVWIFYGNACIRFEKGR